MKRLRLLGYGAGGIFPGRWLQPHLVFRVNGKSAQESYEEHKNQTPRREIPASQEEFRKQLREEMEKRRAR